MIRNLSSLAFSSFVIVSAGASVALAHGPVLQLSIENNQIVTRDLFLRPVVNPSTLAEEYTPLNRKTRLYNIPMVQRSLGDANDGWYGQVNSVDSNSVYLGPGIAYGLGGFSSGVQIRESFADGLKIWNGTGFSDPGTEAIQGLRGSITSPSTTLKTSDSGPFQSFAITTPATITAGSHSQVFWRLLGDGNTAGSVSDDGVYLATFQLSTTQAGIAPSEPFYILFAKNASGTEVNAANAYMNANVVPEPATFGVMGVIALGLRSRRRKHA